MKSTTGWNIVRDHWAEASHAPTEESEYCVAAISVGGGLVSARYLPPCYVPTFFQKAIDLPTPVADIDPMRHANMNNYGAFR